MPIYKEVAKLDKVTHNGKKYLKGSPVRERVVLTELQAKTLNDDPTITGCEYVLIEEPKDGRKELFEQAKELGLDVAKNISTKKLNDLINETLKNNA